MSDQIQILKILDYEIDRAYCTFIKYKNVRILIDCGLSTDFNTSKYEKHHDLLKNVDLIIITASEIQNAGALCFLLNKYNHFVS